MLVVKLFTAKLLVVMIHWSVVIVIVLAVVLVNILLLVVQHLVVIVTMRCEDSNGSKSR